MMHQASVLVLLGVQHTLFMLQVAQTLPQLQVLDDVELRAAPAPEAEHAPAQSSPEPSGRGSVAPSPQQQGPALPAPEEQQPAEGPRASWLAPMLSQPVTLPALHKQDSGRPKRQLPPLKVVPWQAMHPRRDLDSARGLRHSHSSLTSHQGSSGADPSPRQPQLSAHQASSRSPGVRGPLPRQASGADLGSMPGQASGVRPGWRLQPEEPAGTLSSLLQLSTALPWEQAPPGPRLLPSSAGSSAATSRPGTPSSARPLATPCNSDHRQPLQPQQQQQEQRGQQASRPAVQQPSPVQQHQLLGPLPRVLQRHSSAGSSRPASARGRPSSADSRPGTLPAASALDTWSAELAGEIVISDDDSPQQTQRGGSSGAVAGQVGSAHAYMLSTGWSEAWLPAGPAGYRQCCMLLRSGHNLSPVHVFCLRQELCMAMHGL